MLSRFARFCLDAGSLGITEATPFDQRKRLQVINVSVIGMAFGAALRLGVHILARTWNFIPFTLVLLSLSLVALGLLLRKRFEAAIAVALFNAGVMFTLMGWSLHHGMEHLLLLLMLVATFLFDKSWLRGIALLGSSVAFLGVKAHLFVSSPSLPINAVLYGSNLVAFLIGYVFLLAVMREIYSSYRREVEEKNVKLHQANLAKERLLSIVAHDLTGPIGNLKGVLDGLDHDILTPEEFAMLRSELQEGVDHVHKSMGNILIWASGGLRSMEPRFQPVPLRAVADQGVHLLSGIAGRKRIMIENRIPPAALAHADPDQVGTVLRNLLSNALKFTPAGGRIGVEAEPEGTGRWRLRVQDTGIGMAPERARMLFTDTPHHSAPGTENEKGLGLGLRICREFVEKNRGTIWVESIPGEGTSIHFTLDEAPVGEAQRGERDRLAG